MNHTSPHIDDRVFAKLSAAAALHVPGVVPHASGIDKLRKRPYPRAEITQTGHHGDIRVDIEIAVHWPSPIVHVAETVRACVSRWLNAYTGRNVVAVNVDIAAVVPTPQEDSVPPSYRRHHRPVSSADLAALSLDPPVSAPQARVLPAAAVPSPAPVQVRHPQQPAAPQVYRPAAPPAVHVKQPGRLPALEVYHPEAPRSPQVYRPQAPAHAAGAAGAAGAANRVIHVRPPQAAPLRVIPTPTGLPCRDIPTPQGLPITIYPTTPQRPTRFIALPPRKERS